MTTIGIIVEQEAVRIVTRITELRSAAARAAADAADVALARRAM